MNETCPLDLLRQPERLDDDFRRAYRRQAADLGWFAMLVPEDAGGGSLSGNGMLDAAFPPIDDPGRVVRSVRYTISLGEVVDVVQQRALVR